MIAHRLSFDHALFSYMSTGLTSKASNGREIVDPPVFTSPVVYLTSLPLLDYNADLWVHLEHPIGRPRLLPFLQAKGY